VLASACIPSFHHAIEIDNDAYWDGGLSANPPVRPLLYECNASDILLVLLHSRHRSEQPTTAKAIGHRLAEISFSSTLFSELEGIALAKREAARSWFSPGYLERKLRRLKLHLVDAQTLMSRLSHSSKLNTATAFIHALRDEGRRRAEMWLNDHGPDIGVRSSFVFEELR
jgi:NTE family protein